MMNSMENGIAAEIRTTYSLSQAKFIKASYSITYSILAVRMVSFYGAFFLVSLLASGKNVQSSSAIFAGLMVIVAVMMPVMIYFSAKKTYAQNRFVREAKECIITQDQLTIRSSSSTTRLKWSDFERFKRTSSFLLFYISKNQAIIVPTSALKPLEVKQIAQHVKLTIKHKGNKLSAVFIVILSFLLLVGLLRSLA